MTATEAIYKMVRIIMKCKEDLQEVLDEYSYEHGKTNTERLCYYAKKEGVPRILRAIVYNGNFPGSENDALEKSDEYFSRLEATTGIPPLKDFNTCSNG